MIDVMLWPDLLCHDLGSGHTFHAGRLPDDLVWSSEMFEQVWAMHPAEYHQIMMHGHLISTPRWQQAYGVDYHYTGRVNRALPMPQDLGQLLSWARREIDGRLNGTLVNWYDGGLRHYIGAHRDSTKNMVKGAPIVTVSFGETRRFRLRPWKGRGFQDFSATHGTVFVMPYQTNLHFTHEVPHAVDCRGRRVSVTFRALRPALV